MKILILDEHALFTAGLASLINQHDQRFEIFEATNINEAMGTLRSDDNIQLVLLDIQLSQSSGFDAISAVKRIYPQMPIIILSDSENIVDMKQAFHLGASGYILKSEKPEIMFLAMQLVLSGGTYIPRRLSILYQEELSKGTAISLTPKQTEVLQLVKQGLSNKQIAEKMNITVSTIKIHTSAIFKTLGVHNRIQAAIIANNLGI